MKESKIRNQRTDFEGALYADQKPLKNYGDPMHPWRVIAM